MRSLDECCQFAGGNEYHVASVLPAYDDDVLLLDNVLKQRAPELPAPILMSDALSRNTPKLQGVEPLQGNCLAHGRRQFVEVAENFPEECRFVLETLRGVYRHDGLAWNYRDPGAAGHLQSRVI